MSSIGHFSLVRAPLENVSNNDLLPVTNFKGTVLFVIFPSLEAKVSDASNISLKAIKAMAAEVMTTSAAIAERHIYLAL